MTGQANHTRKPFKVIWADGKVDIVIGTHKILQQNIQFKNLGPDDCR